MVYFVVPHTKKTLSLATERFFGAPGGVRLHLSLLQKFGLRTGPRRAVW
jgi:hypothetical protein